MKHRLLVIATTAALLAAMAAAALAAIPETKVWLNNGTPASQIRVDAAAGTFECEAGRHVAASYSTNVKVATLPASATRYVGLIDTNWWNADGEFQRHVWSGGPALSWQTFYPDNVGWDGRRLFARVDWPEGAQVVYVDFEGLQVANWAGVEKARGIAKGFWCTSNYPGPEATTHPWLGVFEP